MRKRQMSKTWQMALRTKATKETTKLVTDPGSENTEYMYILLSTTSLQQNIKHTFVFIAQEKFKLFRFSTITNWNTAPLKTSNEGSAVNLYSVDAWSQLEMIPFMRNVLRLSSSLIVIVNQSQADQAYYRSAGIFPSYIVEFYSFFEKGDWQSRVFLHPPVPKRSLAWKC